MSIVIARHLKDELACCQLRIDSVGGEPRWEIRPAPAEINFQNPFGLLLLPTWLAYEHRQRIALEGRSPGGCTIHYDCHGRVHFILTSKSLIKLDELWARPTLHRQFLHLEEDALTKPGFLLSPTNLTRVGVTDLRLPPCFDLQFPLPGQYMVEYDKGGRVFSLATPTECVSIDSLWDTRFTAPVLDIYAPVLEEEEQLPTITFGPPNPPQELPQWLQNKLEKDSVPSWGQPQQQTSPTPTLPWNMSSLTQQQQQPSQGFNFSEIKMEEDKPPVASFSF
jgi:hypothetical protein